jgi:hypothetical protein
MLHQLAVLTARLLMINPLVTALLFIGAVVSAWYFTIAFFIDEQYFYCGLTFAFSFITAKVLNHFVLPEMKAIKQDSNGLS